MGPQADYTLSRLHDTEPWLSDVLPDRVEGELREACFELVSCIDTYMASRTMDGHADVLLRMASARMRVLRALGAVP